MKYTSDLIFEAAQKSQNVKLFVEDVFKKIKLHLTNHNKTFQAELDRNLNISGINDAEVIIYEESSIVQFESESKKDFIPIIIKNSIRNEKNIKIPIEELPIFEIDNVQEPEKCINNSERNSELKQKDSEGFSFSVQRLAPGYFLFTSVFSRSMADKKNIELETVIGTAILLSLIQSNADVKHQEIFNASFTAKENYLKLKREQSDLIDKLVNQEIDFETWQKLNDEYMEYIYQAKLKLDEKL